MSLLTIYQTTNQSLCKWPNMIENCGRCQRSGVKKIVKLIDDVFFIHQDSFKGSGLQILVVSASKNDFSENDFCIISIIIYLHHPVAAFSLSLVVKRENHQICKTSLQQCSKTNPRGKTYQLQAYLNIYHTGLQKLDLLLAVPHMTVETSPTHGIARSVVRVSTAPEPTQQATFVRFKFLFQAQDTTNHLAKKMDLYGFMD